MWTTKQVNYVLGVVIVLILLEVDLCYRKNKSVLGCLLSNKNGFIGGCGCGMEAFTPKALLTRGVNRTRKMSAQLKSKLGLPNKSRYDSVVSYPSGDYSSMYGPVKWYSPV